MAEHVASIDNRRTPKGFNGNMGGKSSKGRDGTMLGVRVEEMLGVRKSFALNRAGEAR